MTPRHRFLTCDGCAASIDTEEDDEYCDGEQNLCAKCRAAWEAEGRALAAEYQAERLERETPVLCRRCGEGFTIGTLEEAFGCEDPCCAIQEMRP